VESTRDELRWREKECGRAKCGEGNMKPTSKGFERCPTPFKPFPPPSLPPSLAPSLVPCLPSYLVSPGHVAEQGIHKMTFGVVLQQSIFQSPQPHL